MLAPPVPVGRSLLFKAYACDDDEAIRTPAIAVVVSNLGLFSVPSAALPALKADIIKYARQRLEDMLDPMPNVKLEVKEDDVDQPSDVNPGDSSPFSLSLRLSLIMEAFAASLWGLLSCHKAGAETSIMHTFFHRFSFSM